MAASGDFEKKLKITFGHPKSPPKWKLYFDLEGWEMQEKPLSFRIFGSLLFVEHNSEISI
jgi:hypothetical protein